MRCAGITHSGERPHQSLTPQTAKFNVASDIQLAVDGGRLFVSSGETVHVLDAKTLQPPENAAWNPPGLKAKINGMAASANANRLLVCTTDGKLRFLDFGSGKETRTVELPGLLQASLFRPVIAGDNVFVAAAGTLTSKIAMAAGRPRTNGFRARRKTRIIATPPVNIGIMARKSPQMITFKLQPPAWSRNSTFDCNCNANGAQVGTRALHGQQFIRNRLSVLQLHMGALIDTVSVASMNHIRVSHLGGNTHRFRPALAWSSINIGEHPRALSYTRGFRSGWGGVIWGVRRR